MKNLNLIKLMAALSIVVFPILVLQQSAYAKSQGKVLAEKLNVRKTADISGDVMEQVHRGETFDILQTKNGWYQIKLENNETGWVDGTYLSNNNNEATINAYSLRVHKNPSLISSVAGYLKMGSKISILEEQAGWAKILSSSGVQGWVSEKYITKNVSNSTKPVSTTTPAPKQEGTDSSKPGLSRQSVAPDPNSLSKDTLLDNQGALQGKTIVLDPGHGGKDDGTTSITGTSEKSLTLTTALAVEQKLESAGAHVLMTRTNDTYIPLSQRAGLSNQNHADAFISFHYNWSDDASVNGLTDFYFQASRDNTLAADILNEVVNITGLKNNGTKFNNLEVLRDNTEPSTLIELGFVSNKQDDAVVENPSYPYNVAQGVYLGLLDYFSNKK